PYALAESVKNIFGYQYTIPTHQGRGAEQIYIPVLIKNASRKKAWIAAKWWHSLTIFDTTQGHSQINGCTVRNVISKKPSIRACVTTLRQL
ncbi:beta-eliminating lyase-related protein, partial [Escherichia coli]